MHLCLIRMKRAFYAGLRLVHLHYPEAQVS